MRRTDRTIHSRLIINMKSEQYNRKWEYYEKLGDGLEVNIQDTNNLTPVNSLQYN